MPYIGKSANGFGIRERYRYSASGSQTAFTGSDLDSKTLQIDNGSLVDVYLNGVLLDTADYNTSTANTVTLTSGATASDEVMIVVYDVFSLSDAMPKTGGTFSGGIIANSTLDMNGTELILDADADTSITADTDDQIDIKVAGSDLAHITSTYAKLRGATPLVFGENNATGTYQSISGEVGANNLLLRSYQSLTFKNGTSGSSLTDGTTALNIDANGIITMPKQPMFEVTKGSEQTISTDTLTKVTFSTEVYDLNGDFDLSNDKFIAPVAGKYLFQAYITFGTMVAGAGMGLVWKKDGTIVKHGHHQSTEINITFGLSSTIAFDLSASDEIELFIFHGSGSNQTCGTANNTFSGSSASSNYWSGQLIG